MGIVFGLLAALLWGGGDFLINRLTNLIGTTRALVATQALSLLCWIGMAFILGFPSNVSMELWGTALVCGVFHVAALVLTYRAFEIGALSIVSPIASSFAIVTAVLELATGERPGLAAVSGAVLLVVGVVVVSRGSPAGGTVTLKGVPEALGSALGFGIMFWRIEDVFDHTGVAAPLIVLKVMATATAIGAFWINRKKREKTPSTVSKFGVVLLGLGVAVSDSLAWWAWIVGNTTSFNTVVTALASLFSVVTVVLAAVFLKERLNKSQFLGVAVVLLGVLLVSLP